MLPNAESTAARRSRGEPDIYLAWDGEVYGPTGIEEIMAGIRASYFEKDTTFWFEGLAEWRSLEDFETVTSENNIKPGVSGPAPGNASDAKDQAAAATHPQPAAAVKRKPRSGPGRSKPPRPRPTGSRVGMLLVALFILLGAGLTAGIILALWRFI